MKHKRLLIIAIPAFILLATSFIDIAVSRSALSLAMGSFRQLVIVLPPIFVLMGLLDVWVPRETMVRYMGQGSGIMGILIAFFLGSAAAGPLYGAFPVAAVLMKKGARFSNILIFIGAWSTTKIPLLMFEYGAMGPAFTLTRLAINIPIIIAIAIVIQHLVSEEQIQSIYQQTEKMLS